MSEQTIVSINNQLSLLDYGGLSEDLIKVFAVKTRTNDKGVLTNQRLALMKRKDVARANGLEDNKANRAAIDKIILQQRDELKTKLREIADKIDKDPAFTGGALSVNKGKNGGSISMRFAKIDRGHKVSDEDLAAALSLYTKKPVTVEEVKAMRKRQEETIDAQQITDVKQVA